MHAEFSQLVFIWQWKQKAGGHPSGKVASGRVAKTEKKTRIICSGGKAVDWETR